MSSRLLVSARVPKAVFDALEDFSESETGGDRQEAIVVLLRQSLGVERPASEALEVLRVPNLRDVLERHPRGGGDPDDLRPVLELARAILFDLARMFADGVDAIRAWAEHGGDPPKALTDPRAMVPFLAEIRKTVSALHKNRLRDAMTAREVLAAFEKMGDEVRDAVGEVLRRRLAQSRTVEIADVATLEQEVYDESRARWERIEGVEEAAAS